MGYKLVSIIILNLNGKEFTKNCLEAIKKNTSYKNYNVIIVDNNSNDGSREMIKSNFKWVDLLENNSNRGFSGGNNDGINYAIKRYNPDYVYLLNNDTLVEKNWLSEAVKTIQKNSATGIVGSKQLNFDKKPVISSGWVNSWGVKYYWGNEEKEVSWVSGAGFLVAKKVIEKVGILDEIYSPAYYEETDFEKRATKQGFKIIHCPKSIFLHKGGATSKKEVRNFSGLFYRNRFIYFIKNHGYFYFLPRAISDCFKEFKKNNLSGVLDLLSFYKKGYFLIKKNKNLDLSSLQIIREI